MISLQVKQKKVNAAGIKFFLVKEGKEIGRAYLYLIHNDLHREPFGLMEDVFVEEEYRGQGLGTKLTKAVIQEAKKHCYKLICTSRHSKPKVHELYQKLGFKNHGLEFRMDFEE
ncbi:MAG TPA: GNAT family N-acetyltransferase [Candidatus Nanoarchaeia archaeon]|nr:GNAT family N-acetyltransferase [Candidatus Nanoarchaeia archaeon]